MIYVDNNPARNCPELLALIHESISSGFFKLAQYANTLDCGVRSDCGPCLFATGNSSYGCPCGGVPNLDLDEYVKSCYPELFV